MFFDVGILIDLVFIWDGWYELEIMRELVWVFLVGFLCLIVVFVVNDFFVIVVIEVVYELGLWVLEDFFVVGFDDVLEVLCCVLLFIMI